MCCNYQSFDSCLQSGVQNRGEARVVIGRQSIQSSFLALAYSSASSPPKNQYTAGAFHCAPKHPKSSLAMVGFVCSTEPSGKFWRNASTTFFVAITSFVTNEYRS